MEWTTIRVSNGTKKLIKEVKNKLKTKIEYKFINLTDGEVIHYALNKLKEK